MIEWRDIPGFPYYQASNDGQVRSIDKTTYRKGKPWRFKGKVLPGRKNHDGYLRVRIGEKLKFVHSLILLAFVSEQPTGMQCCHNNGIPDDNRLENLRWDYPKNNVADRLQHGTYQHGEKNPNAKLSEKDALDILLSDKTAFALSVEYGIHPTTVINIRSGHRWGHLYEKLKSGWTPRIIDLS